MYGMRFLKQVQFRNYRRSYETKELTGYWRTFRNWKDSRFNWGEQESWTATLWKAESKLCDVHNAHLHRNKQLNGMKNVHFMCHRIAIVFSISRTAKLKKKKQNSRWSLSRYFVVLFSILFPMMHTVLQSKSCVRVCVCSYVLVLSEAMD